MGVPVSRRKKLIYLLLIAVVCLITARNDRAGTWVRGKVFALCSPFVKAGGFVADKTRSAAAALRSRQSLLAENAELKHAEVRLAEAERRLAEMEQENERLRNLLALPKRASDWHASAEVVGRDTTQNLSAITINLGADHGVEKDMAVLTAAGVVGRVWSVSDGAALVQTITDRNSGVAALDQRSRVQGIVIGAGDQAGLMKYIPKSEDIRPGDKIVTSALDGIYPKGHEIGVVESVENPPGFFKRVRLRLSVPFNRLEEVTVVDSRNAGDDSSEEAGEEVKG